MKKIFVVLVNIGFFNLAFAVGESEPVNKSYNDFNVKMQLINKNLQLTITNNLTTPLMITQINQYTSNDNSCAFSKTNYLLANPKTPLIIFPFSVDDMNNCQKNIYVFKHYSSISSANLINVYSKLDLKLNDYLTDWGAYLAVPMVIKITYTVNNISGQKANVAYYVYKINE